MSAGHSQPQVLYSVRNIRAFSVQNGQEHEITTSGPQELTLLMVPTSSPFADLSSAEPQSAAPEEDFYLHLNLPPELDLPLPATTQIYHRPPTSYLIPRWDLDSDSGAFIRIEFPGIGVGPGKVSREEVDTFETILAQCTAFLERAPMPEKGGPYNPSMYKPGEAYISSGTGGAAAPNKHGQIVLIDEENGSVVGELSGGYTVNEASNVVPGSKLPVEIQLPAEGQGNQIQVSNVSEEYLGMARHPAYAKSTIVQTSARASRLIVAGSTAIANAMATGADKYTKNHQPNPKPMTFTPATRERVRQIHSLTDTAVGISSKTLGQLTRHAQNMGARLAGNTKVRDPKGFKDGKPDTGYKPGILNKSMIAFSTIADGVDQAGRQLLSSGSAVATNVVGHKYGKEAGDVTAQLSGGVKNVGLVYIDAVGVSRRAVIKSVAKGMVVGRMPDGQPLIVGAGDGGVVPGEAYPAEVKQSEKPSALYGGPGGTATTQPGHGVEGYGLHAAQPPTYSGGYSNVGEPMGSVPQGQQYPHEKR